MNIIHIAGRLGADPEVRFTSNGQKVTTFRVATNSRKSGKDETIWWRVTVWGDQNEKMISFLKKGSAVIIVGEFHKPEIFTDRDGKAQISMSMTASNVMFSPFGRSDKQAEGSTTTQRSQNANPEYAQMAKGEKKAEETQDFSDDEIPF